MKWLMIAGALLLAQAGMVYGQTGAGLVKEYSISAGKAETRLEDPFILSFPIRGNAFQADASFSRQDAAKRQSFSMEWDKTFWSNGQVAVKADGFQLRFSQGFSLLKSGNGRFRSYTGYSLQTHPVFIKATGKDEEDRYSWSTTNNLSLYQSAAYTAGKNQWTLDVYVPVIGLAARPGQQSNKHNTLNGLLYDSYKNLFVTSWHNQHTVSALLGFSHAFTERFRFHLDARVYYNSLEAEHTYREKTIGLSAGISWLVR